MPSLKVMTFNVENMLVRFDFRKWEKESLATFLDIDSEMDRANLIRTHWNVINDENRVFTALTMKEEDPDVVCIQEVEDLRSLEAFHDRYLRRIGDQTFPYRVLIEGNDPRGIDVAVLSRFKIESLSTHREMVDPAGIISGRVFRRDCLEVNIKKQNKILPIFVCHFKSMSGGREETRPLREAEARTVKKILEDRFGDPSQHSWLVVGDLNDYTEEDGQPDNEHGLTPLLEGNFAVDLVKRIPDPRDRWTHFYSGDRSYHQLDYILASKALADQNPAAVPRIIRQGQPYRADRYQGPRWPRVGYDRPKASDHSPVVIELEY